MEKLVLAALEREPEVNLHRWPVRVEYDVVNRVLTLDGQVQNVAAKRHAYECASRIDGVDGVIDQLRVQPATTRGDGAIRVAVVEALLGEPSLRDCGVHALHKGLMETLRVAPNSSDMIGISVEDGVIMLTGHVSSLSHKRLAGALAWWTPGCRDVLNEPEVRPAEQDNDAEITDALRLIFEKDPLLVHADDIGVRVTDRAVTLAGVVTTAEERRMAEFDAWYVCGMRAVANDIEVRRVSAR
ncbi:MAG: BON domain-containing protein [Chromatiales bacterium]|nr:BON domain-containing protein [Chromatiales bacterium]